MFGEDGKFDGHGLLEILIAAVVSIIFIGMIATADHWTLKPFQKFVAWLGRVIRGR